MATKNKELEMFSFDQIKEEFIGEIGTEKRTHYEQELQLEILGKMIRKVRLEIGRRFRLDGVNKSDMRWQCARG